MGYGGAYGDPALGLEILGASAQSLRGSDRQLVETQYTRERGLIMGFGSATVALNASATFSANPQVPFRPSSLIISATAIAGLTVDDIKVGKNSQLVTSGAVPAAAFGADTTFKAMKFDTAGPGIDVSVDVTDTSGAANTVAMAMFGVAAER